jgi:hypothetical protein
MTVSGLDGLARRTAAVTRSISAENPTGAKGAGGGDHVAELREVCPTSASGMTASAAPWLPPDTDT